LRGLRAGKLHGRPARCVPSLWPDRDLIVDEEGPEWTTIRCASATAMFSPGTPLGQRHRERLAARDGPSAQAMTSPPSWPGLHGRNSFTPGKEPGYQRLRPDAVPQALGATDPGSGRGTRFASGESGAVFRR
jgi:hypothetical protein